MVEFLPFLYPTTHYRRIIMVSCGRPCVCPSVCISFPDDILSKYQWIYTKLGMCIDIVEIWFWIADGQISSIFDRVICWCQVHIFAFMDDNLSKNQWIFTKLDVCIDMVEICFGFPMGKFRQLFTELSARYTIVTGYYRFPFSFLTRELL